MRLLWGIFAALVLITASMDVGISCISQHDSKSQISFAADHQSHSNNPEHGDSDGCPMNCHNSGSHCHNSCFQHFNPGSVSLESRENPKLGIYADFRAPVAPYLEGNRKPPKFS